MTIGIVEKRQTTGHHISPESTRLISRIVRFRFCPYEEGEKED
jgi:hypothetical protein